LLTFSPAADPPAPPLYSLSPLQMKCFSLRKSVPMASFQFVFFPFSVSLPDGDWLAPRKTSISREIHVVTSSFVPYFKRLGAPFRPVPVPPPKISFPPLVPPATVSMLQVGDFLLPSLLCPGFRLSLSLHRSFALSFLLSFPLSLRSLISI